MMNSSITSSCSMEVEDENMEIQEEFVILSD